MLLALLVGLGPGRRVAQPNPPPNPSDDDLRRSRDAVSQRAGEVGRLTSQLAELDSRTDDLRPRWPRSGRRAEAALIDLQSAQDAAAAAAQRAADARIETEAASTAIEQARSRLDEFVTATYQQQLDTGPLALLTEATSPEDLVARAEFDDAIARTQLGRAGRAGAGPGGQGQRRLGRPGRAGRGPGPGGRGDGGQGHRRPGRRRRRRGGSGPGREAGRGGGRSGPTCSGGWTRRRRRRRPARPASPLRRVAAPFGRGASGPHGTGRWPAGAPVPAGGVVQP